MRSLRAIVEALTRGSLGFSADGRRIGIGLDAALKAQRARGADVRPLRPAHPVPSDDTYARAS